MNFRRWCAHEAQGRLAIADIGDMYTTKNPMKANAWYRAYLKENARLVNVKYLGITDQGLRFADQEENLYTPQDFYFWKSAGDN